MREIEKRSKKLIKNMNDRLYKLQKNKLPSRALDYLKSELPERYQLLHVTKSGYIQFNQRTKDMSFNDLQHYEKILNNFKKAKTSTIRGAKKYYKESQERLFALTGINDNQFATNMFNSAWLKYAVETFGASETFKVIKEYGQQTATEIFTIAMNNGVVDIVGLYVIIEQIENKYKSVIV